jgi:hypothetical protein
MSKQIEALKLALEAFGEIEWSNNSQWQSDRAKVAITTLKEALANEALEKMAENARELGLDYEPPQPEHGWTPERIAGMARLKEAQDKKLAQPEFIKHEVKNADDWSEWVCPDPKNYLMKCCDCGLVHEAEFAVVRYKSETERDDCDMVDDPNLQAVFRMRRSEEWTPEDTAHRSGGLPMAQLEQEPVAWRIRCTDPMRDWVLMYRHPKTEEQFLNMEIQPLYTTPPQRKPLTDEEIETYRHMIDWTAHWSYINFARAIEAALRTKNT